MAMGMGTDKITYLMTTPVPLSAQVLLLSEVGGGVGYSAWGMWYVHLVRKVWPWRWRGAGWSEPVLGYLWGPMWRL